MKLISRLSSLAPRSKVILGLTGILILLILLQLSIAPNQPATNVYQAPTSNLNQQKKLAVIEQLPLVTDNYIIEFLTTANTFLITVDSQPYYQHLEEAYQWLNDQGITQENSSIEEGYSRYKPID